MAGLLGLLNYHPLLKTEQDLTTPPWLIWPPLAVGILWMVMGFRHLPFRRGPDLGRKYAWIGLGMIWTVGAVLRLYRLGEPPGLFWDDWATTLVWVHNILDKNKFFWMMPSDGIEPFNPYVLTALRAVIPDDIRDIVVRRIASCLIDMVALWVLYLGGKELGSRRTGLIAATLGALGRPMIQLTLTGMRAYNLSLAVGLLILASLKMFRKPSLKNFLLWGFALAFGTHTYSSFRVYLLLVPFLVLPWVFKDQVEIRKQPLTWLTPWGPIFILLGILSGTFAVTDSRFMGWSRFWDDLVARPEIISSIFIVCLAPSIYTCWIFPRNGKVPRLASWSLAVGLGSLMIFPLTLSDEFNGRMAVLSPFRPENNLGDVGGFLSDQVWQTLKSLFYYCKDRKDLTIGTEPFYDLFSQGALVLGFSFFLARPDWKKAFLLTLGVLGTVVYVISFDPASTKLIGSAPAFYLFAALAVERLWEALPSPSRLSTKKWEIFLGVFLMGYAVWGFWVQKTKILDMWAKFPGIDTQLARILAQEESRYRIYLAPSAWFFGWSAQFVLNEGRRYYVLKESNSIPVNPGETPQDVEIILFGSNENLIQTLHQQFPKSIWIQQYVLSHKSGDTNPELYVWRVLIPGKFIPSNKDFTVHRNVQKGRWLRRYYNPLYGWGLSGILMEEKTDHVSETLDLKRLIPGLFGKYSYARLIQFLGRIRVEKGGKTEWSIHSGAPLWIQIDGKTVWKKDVRTTLEKFSFSTDLEPGMHTLEIRARLSDGYQMPEIGWREDGEQAEMAL